VQSAALPVSIVEGTGHIVRHWRVVQAQAASERGSQADVVHAAEELQVCLNLMASKPRVPFASESCGKLVVSTAHGHASEVIQFLSFWLLGD